MKEKYIHHIIAQNVAELDNCNDYGNRLGRKMINYEKPCALIFEKLL